MHKVDEAVRVVGVWRWGWRRHRGLPQTAGARLRNALARVFARFGQLLEPGCEWPFMTPRRYNCKMIGGPADDQTVRLIGGRRYAHIACVGAVTGRPTTAIYERISAGAYAFVGMSDDLVERRPEDA